MKTKGKNTINSINEHRNSDTGTTQKKDDSIAILLLCLYLLVDFIPYLGAIDVRGPQWFYLSLINLVVAIYFLTKPKIYLIQRFNFIAADYLTISYFLLFIVCGFSIFFAVNKIESLVVYSRLAISLISFLIFILLIYSRLYILKKLFQIISISVLIQCIPVLYIFEQNIGLLTMNELISGMTGNSGNKNVLAATLVIKLPAILFCIYNYKTPIKNLINILSLALSIILIFILNARAAYLAFFIQAIIYLSYINYLNPEKISSQQKTGRLLKFLIPLLFMFFAAQSILRHIESKDPSTAYGTITKRLGTLSNPTEASGGRFFFWGNAVDYIKKHPFTGSGYGNWKIVSVEYEKSYNNNFDFSKQVHNDFLQITAESGIFAGLCFIALFVLSLIYILKILNSNSDKDIKTLSLFTIIGLAGYFIDALFNFPTERPVMQVYFVFALAIMTVTAKSIHSTDQAFQKQKKIFIPALTGLIFLIIGSIFITYSTYKSMKIQLKLQFTIKNNNSLKNLGVPSQVINSEFPSIPNLTENNIPVDIIKAWLVYNEGKYEEALKLTNQSNNVNPFAGYTELVKATIFFAMNNIDSAFHYSRKGFYKRPRNSELFSIFAKSSVQKKDSETIKEAFNLYRKYANDPESWQIYIRSLFEINKDQDEVLRLSDSISKVFPKNAEIQNTRYFVKANISALNKDFKSALKNLEGIMKIYPNNIKNIENIGLTYYYMKDYPMAIKYFEKVILSRVDTNGKSEFFIAKCLLNTGNKDAACNYLLMSAKKNYPGASKLVEDYNCNVKDSGTSVQVFTP